MEVVEIREGNINIESEEEEDETDDPQHSEGHLVFVSGCSLREKETQGSLALDVLSDEN